MSETHVLLFDLGTEAKVPGFPEDYLFSDLPLAGNFTGLEMSAANFASFSGARFHLITPSSYLKQREDTVKDWVGKITVLPDGGDLRKPLQSIQMKNGGMVVMQNLSSAVSLDSRFLEMQTANISGDQLLKCSVQDTPVELFICSADFFKRFVQRITEIGSPIYAEEFFKQLLLQFTDLLDIPGTIFFHNNLYLLYQSHLHCIGEKRFVHPDLYRLYDKKPMDSIIGKSGSVTRSLVSPGSKIDGYIENSFVFKNVHVREGAKISNSIVFPGHTIGKKAIITNAVLLPYRMDSPTGTTIGDKAMIGGSSKTANKDFPEHLQSGLTVIGVDTEIPANFVMEASTCVDYGVSKNFLKQREVIKKGVYVSPDG